MEKMVTVMISVIAFYFAGRTISWVLTDTKPIWYLVTIPAWWYVLWGYNRWVQRVPGRQIVGSVMIAAAAMIVTNFYAILDWGMNRGLNGGWALVLQVLALCSLAIIGLDLVMDPPSIDSANDPDPVSF